MTTRSFRGALLLTFLALCAPACSHYREPYYKLVPGSPAPSPHEELVDHRLFLIGDAGDAERNREPALLLLARRVDDLPDRSTVVFLGDNVYERGLPPSGKTEAQDEAAEAANLLFLEIFDSRKEGETRLDAQIDTVRGSTARAIFIPGNHDWDPLAPDGWKRVLEQEKYLRDASMSGSGVDVTMLPGGGCPGPVSVKLGREGMLITLDTQWFLELAIEHDRPNDKPCEANNPTNCPCVTEDEVVAELIAQLRTAARQRRWAVLVGHHPLNSQGPHAGFVEPWTHLFPMRFMRHYLPWYLEWLPAPGLGTLAVLARQYFSPSPQDTSNGLNQHLRRLLRGAMADAEKEDAPVLLYAAGHDHSLQVFKTPKGPRFNVVSGLGSTSRASEVGSTHNTLFAHADGRRPGFMQVDFMRNGAVRLAVIEADGSANGAEVYSMVLAGIDAPRGARLGSPSLSLWPRIRNRAVPGFLRPSEY